MEVRRGNTNAGSLKITTDITTDNVDGGEISLCYGILTSTSSEIINAQPVNAGASVKVSRGGANRASLRRF